MQRLFRGRRPPLRWGPQSEEWIIDYLKDLATRLGKQTVTTRDVQKDGQVNPATIIRRFGGFSEALIRADLRPIRIYKRNQTTMLKQLSALIADLGRVPSNTEVSRNLYYSVGQFVREFGSLEKACALATPPQSSQDRPAGSPSSATVLLTRSKKRRRYGPAINFRGLRHAPINELGVVLLFGMLAEELNFVVESVQDGFPDCDAKLKRDDGTFEGVRIEFEFRSSEFRRHRHDAGACDIIVCWEHDWPDCPIEVIALSQVIYAHRSSDGGLPLPKA